MRCCRWCRDERARHGRRAACESAANDSIFSFTYSGIRAAPCFQISRRLPPILLTNFLPWDTRPTSGELPRFAEHALPPRRRPYAPEHRDKALCRGCRNSAFILRSSSRTHRRGNIRPLIGNQGKSLSTMRYISEASRLELHIAGMFFEMPHRQQQGPVEKSTRAAGSFIPGRPRS